MPRHSLGRLSTYMKGMGSCKTCFFSSGGCFGFAGWGRGHATRTLSGSCHPRRGAALKEAESSRGSAPTPTPVVPVHVKRSRMRNRDLSPWSPRRWEHGGQRRQTLVKLLIFPGREEKVEMTERVPFFFLCPSSAPDKVQRHPPSCAKSHGYTRLFFAHQFLICFSSSFHFLRSPLHSSAPPLGPSPPLLCLFLLSPCSSPYFALLLVWFALGGKLRGANLWHCTLLLIQHFHSKLSLKYWCFSMNFKLNFNLKKWDLDSFLKLFEYLDDFFLTWVTISKVNEEDSYTFYL